MTRAELRTNIQDNLHDIGIYYNEDEVNTSIQDSYADIASVTRCILKTVELPWKSASPYLNFRKDFGLADYLGCFGVFNIVTNLWLRDDLSLRHFDDLRLDWELWSGAPQFWAPHSLDLIAVTPNYYTSPGNFRLKYWGAAPVLADDTEQLLIAKDMGLGVEYYCTAELLETNAEMTKALAQWAMYQPLVQAYKKRVQDVASFDNLPRI